ncbi:hypothetical protein QR680_012306 [Steinernema hermaphroditum]|uniref:Uncharacterized protein n=1 Tax=Steinernema hermaphroditum TaxID=289476 RepID=A0AA39M0B1_9BILA|nr:hypothetical protein QR680_012306 [Steinernema hermaphroditum]
MTSIGLPSLTISRSGVRHRRFQQKRKARLRAFLPYMAFLDSTIAALTPYAKKDEKMGLFYANLSGLSNNAALLTKNEESEEYYERILADISPDYKEKRDSSLSTIHKKNNKKIARLRRFRAKEQGQLAFVNELENVFCSHLPLLRERRDSTIERIVEDWFSLQKEHLPDKQLPSTPMERNNTAFKAFLLQQQENQALEEEVKTFEEILNGKLQALRCPSCDILERSVFILVRLVRKRRQY